MAAFQPTQEMAFDSGNDSDEDDFEFEFPLSRYQLSRLNNLEAILRLPITESYISKPSQYPWACETIPMRTVDPAPKAGRRKLLCFDGLPGAGASSIIKAFLMLFAPEFKERFGHNMPNPEDVHLDFSDEQYSDASRLMWHRQMKVFQHPDFVTDTQAARKESLDPKKQMIDWLHDWFDVLRTRCAFDSTNQGPIVLNPSPFALLQILDAARVLLLDVQMDCLLVDVHTFMVRLFNTYEVYRFDVKRWNAPEEITLACLPIHRLLLHSVYSLQDEYKVAPTTTSYDRYLAAPPITIDNTTPLDFNDGGSSDKLITLLEYLLRLFTPILEPASTVDAALPTQPAEESTLETTL
jgi:hypothetical protein